MESKVGASMGQYSTVTDRKLEVWRVTGYHYKLYLLIHEEGFYYSSPQRIDCQLWNQHQVFFAEVGVICYATLSLALTHSGTSNCYSSQLPKFTGQFSAIFHIRNFTVQCKDCSSSFGEWHMHTYRSCTCRLACLDLSKKRLLGTYFKNCTRNRYEFDIWTDYSATNDPGLLWGSSDLMSWLLRYSRYSFNRYHF